MNRLNIQKLYENRFPKSELKRKNDIWALITDLILKKYINQNDVFIDAACGYGEAINNVVAKEKIAIDLNNDSKKYLHEDIEFINDNSIVALQRYKEKANIIFTSNFLEHLPDKKTLEYFLDAVHAALVNNGKYIIIGPNLRYLPGQYWDFYDHNLGLTHLSLIEVLSLHGFQIQVCIDKFLPYTTKSNFPTHPIFVKLYLKCPIVWRFLGKQFFIVAKKI